MPSQREAGYWREVGTIDSYFDAHMDLCAVHPVFNLYNRWWPILTHVPPDPPAKFAHDDDGQAGQAIDSVVSNGVIVSGGLVSNSVLSPGVRVHSRSRVNRAVILHHSVVSRHAVVENAILDKHVVVAEGRHGRGGQGARPSPRSGRVQLRRHRGRQGAGRAAVDTYTVA